MKLMHFILLAVVLAASTIIYETLKPIACVEKRFGRIVGCVPESWVDIPKTEKHKYRRQLKKRFGIAPPIAHAVQEPGHDWFTGPFATINMLPGLNGDQLFEALSIIERDSFKKAFRNKLEQLYGFSDFEVVSAEFSEQERIVWATILYTSVHGENTRQVSAMVMEQNGVFAVDISNPASLAASFNEWQYKDLIRTFQIL